MSSQKMLLNCNFMLNSSSILFFRHRQCNPSYLSFVSRIHKQKYCYFFNSTNRSCNRCHGTTHQSTNKKKNLIQISSCLRERLKQKGKKHAKFTVQSNTTPRTQTDGSFKWKNWMEQTEQKLLWYKARMDLMCSFYV